MMLHWDLRKGLPVLCYETLNIYKGIVLILVIYGTLGNLAEALYVFNVICH